MVVFVFLLFGCFSRQTPDEATPAQEGGSSEPRTVEVVAAKKGRLIERIDSSGLISGINEAYVVSETTGIIEEVRVTLGQQVTKGDLLVRVDDTIAKLNMEQARNQYETAQIDLNAKEASFKSGNVSRAALTQARSTAQGAKAQYERAKKAFEDCSIRSPINGYVAVKESIVSVGNYLTPGSRVARIVDLSVLQVQIAVGEGEIGFIEPGANATVFLPTVCDEQLFNAKVTAVAAGSDSSTGSFAVIVQWPNSCGEKIKAGMSAEVTIEASETEEQLIIPSSAILTQDGSTYVKAVEDSTVVRKPIVIGRRQGDLSVVLQGLEEEDHILVSGLTVVGEGDSVNMVIVER